MSSHNAPNVTGGRGRNKEREWKAERRGERGGKAKENGERGREGCAPIELSKVVACEFVASTLFVQTCGVILCLLFTHSRGSIITSFCKMYAVRISNEG